MVLIETLQIKPSTTMIKSVPCMNPNAALRTHEIYAINKDPSPTVLIETVHNNSSANVD